MRHLNAKGPCPCGSNRLLRDCCLRTGGRLLCKPAKIAIRPPKTGFRHPRCYFRHFGDCSKTLTAEHFFTHAILRLLDEDGHLWITGYPWQPIGEEHRSFSPKSLVSKILCSRHNSALSPLDSVATKFFSVLAGEEFRDHLLRSIDRFYLFNGHDIERWMLKTLIGCVASGNALDQRGNRIQDWTPSPKWLRVLLGRTSFQRKCGLYFNPNLGEKRRDRVCFMGPLEDSKAVICGAFFNLAGFEFVLTMTPPPLPCEGTILEGYTFRPSEFIMSHQGVSKTSLLSWDILGESKSFEFRLLSYHPSGHYFDR